MNKKYYVAGIVALLALAAGAVAIAAAQGDEWYDECPALVEMKPHTPRPTYTPKPTHVPKPTYTPLPTYTPDPTPTCEPTYTLIPTSTEYPTATEYPTVTEYPTYTPYPTSTPYPTQPSGTVTPTNEPEAARAFPGAEGFGADALGGRGGTVIEVTNLNDSGPGSLRACVAVSGPRTCVFKTGGTIELLSGLAIDNPYITIAGQTAPGGGIAITNAYGNNSTPFIITTHDVIMRYLRIRTGPADRLVSSLGVVTTNFADNIIIDHCSLSWGTDQNLTLYRGTSNVTVQWSIISEALNCSMHDEGCHSCGALVGYEGTGNISLHHNLWAHNWSRDPRIKSEGLVDVVNNVIYNAGNSNVSADFTQVPVNYVGNAYIRGLDRPDPDRCHYVATSDPRVNGFAFYVSGNISPDGVGGTCPGRLDSTQPEALIVESSSQQYIVGTRHSAPAITTQLCNSLADCPARDAVLDGAGAILPVRDAVDQRIVNDVINGTGRVIDDPGEVGGWPVLAAGVGYIDSDHDGMPDEWEVARGLDPNDPADGTLDADGDGYTNLEEFLNE